jgi:hypothetical protein
VEHRNPSSKLAKSTFFSLGRFFLTSRQWPPELAGGGGGWWLPVAAGIAAAPKVPTRGPNMEHRVTSPLGVSFLPACSSFPTHLPPYIYKTAFSQKTKGNIEKRSSFSAQARTKSVLLGPKVPNEVFCSDNHGSNPF